MYHLCITINNITEVYNRKEFSFGLEQVSALRYQDNFMFIKSLFIRQMKRNYKTNLARGHRLAFNYHLARLNRMYFTEFNGRYTMNELREKMGLNKQNVISNYKLRKLLDGLYEPVVYSSKFKTKSYKFYTEQHYEEAEKLLEPFMIKDIRAVIKEELKDLVQPANITIDSAVTNFRAMWDEIIQ